MYKPGHILDRYVIRNMLFSYVVVFVVFVGLRIVVDVFTEIDEFTESMLPAGEVMQNIVSYYGYHLFQYYQEFAGPIVVFAAMFTLFRIRRANEMVALLSSGISLYRLLWPVAVVGIVLNSLLVVNQELIIPKLADKLVRRQDNALGGRVVPVALQTDEHNCLLLGQMDPTGPSLEDVFLIVRDERGRTIGLRHAPKAVWDNHNEQWVMEETKSVKAYSTDPVTTSTINYPTDLSPREIALRASSEYIRFQSTTRLAEMGSQPYLRQRMGTELELEKHFRFTGPIINVIILLLAAPLITSREPKSVFLQMVKGLLVIVGAFALAFACQQLGSQHLRPLMAAWLPVILFGPAAVLVLDSVKT